MIDKETSIRLKPSACRAFLKKMGMKCRRCGVVPGKAMDDDKQRQAQQEFHDQQLQSTLDEAKQGKRTVLFVDAAHFVMGAFLGMVWCFVRLLLPSAQRRKRHNVLGAYDPITHEAITVTNDTILTRTFSASFSKKLPMHTLIAGGPLLWCWITPDIKMPVGRQHGKSIEYWIALFATLLTNLNLIERLWRFVKNKFYIANITTILTLLEQHQSCISELEPVSKMRCKAWWPWTSSYFKKTENLTAWSITKIDFMKIW